MFGLVFMATPLLIGFAYLVTWNVTVDKYLELLQEAIDQAINMIIENNHDYLEHDLMFQRNSSL